MTRAAFDPATDYYGLLGVSPSASADEIQAAYRKLAKAYHPDLNAGSSVAAVRMARVNAAKAILLDPPTRAAYDELRRAHRGVAVAAARVRPVSGGGARQVHPSRPSAARVAVSARPPTASTQRRRGKIDRSTIVLTLIALPLVSALLLYVAGAVLVAGRPARTGPSDLALAPISRPTTRGIAEAAFFTVHTHPPSRTLALRANSQIVNRPDGTPEGELLRAVGRRLVAAGTNGDAEAWREAVAELCLIAQQC